MALEADLTHEEVRQLELESLEEKEDKAKDNLLVYQRRLSTAYDK
ncbi:hypothetical protein COLO4_25434 [Corchorus olitorius]|uniref:Uncharacterized protein n=1 Tax=Corchorus olitorius TaxID=93759 RepID=A0A1R3I2M4_9ROSI|nr:hypothetical protein COLO4_25434 [Corchorus olitorius]